jgi:Flp pilus assembly protein TadG
MSEATMTKPNGTTKESSMFSRHGRSRRRQEGQILVVFALGLIVLVAGVALVLEGGNAYQNQRSVQNAADAAANAGATVIAQHLAGVPKTDAQVLSAITASASFNSVTAAAYYTDWQGQPIDASGNVVAANLAVAVGAGPAGAIPPNAQGAHVGGDRTFPTALARVIGFNSFTASADAIAVTGKSNGGRLLPVVFPVNITDCSGNGNLGAAKEQWDVSQPGDAGEHPVGTEYIVPLCKTGGGSFMVLDLDGTPNNCDWEVTHPDPIQFESFPVEVASDNGNNCAKPLVDAVNTLEGDDRTVLIPICDNNECNTSGGSHASYHVTGVVAFYIDYMSDSNNQNNSLCQTHYNNDTPEPQLMVTIAGNGSSSCIAGWFVRFITVGPVGAGTVGNGDAISIQLIK